MKFEYKFRILREIKILFLDLRHLICAEVNILQNGILRTSKLLRKIAFVFKKN